MTPEQQVIVTNESASRTELTIGHFEGVQFLRFLAAFVVLLTHATFFYSTRKLCSYNRQIIGVDKIILIDITLADISFKISIAF